jgi:hypothetical protein
MEPSEAVPLMSTANTRNGVLRCNNIRIPATMRYTLLAIHHLTPSTWIPITPEADCLTRRL